MSEQLKKSAALLLELMQSRHSVRMFSSREIPIEVIKDCIAIAGTAPSGANMQPWSFVVVKDQKVKMAIREEAERIARSALSLIEPVIKKEEAKVKRILEELVQ